MLDHAPSPDRLASVATALDRVDLGLAGGAAVAARDRALRSIRDYLVPRIAHADDGLVIAVVGVSGSGKSTLINSLARRRITETGTLRPTTIEPIAWGGEMLPATLDALRRRLPGRMVDSLRPPPDGVTLVDTPPPGVLDGAGASIAAQVLAVADACVLVAGAHRYADAAGFELAALASARDLPIVFVLNRLPPTPEMQRMLIEDFAAKLAGRGLIARPAVEAIVAIPEGVVSSERSGLATDAVLGLRKEVERLADPHQRMMVLRASVSRSVEMLEADLDTVRRALIEAEARRSALADPVTISYASAAAELADLLRRGAFAAVKEDPEQLADMLAAAAARRAGQAASRAADLWEGMAAAPVSSDLFTHGRGTPEVARERLAWWCADLPRLAGEATGRTVKGRRADRLVAAVRRAVFDPAHQATRRERRILARHPGLVALASDRLAEELAGITEVDAARFTAALGGVTPWGVLNDLTLETP